MGKVKLGALPTKNSINHFSHPHPLELTPHHTQQGLIPSSSSSSSSLSCSACKLQLISDSSFYACKTCNFSLHADCFKLPREITHPFHNHHVFTLLPKSPYPFGVFTCDACGEQGDGFSYHCNTCGLDLHILCSVLPLSVTHPSHHHPLQIIFPTPHSQKQVFACDVCKNLGKGNFWKYRCNSCDFDAHLSCTKLQEQSSLQSSAHTVNASASRIAPQQHHTPQPNLGFRPPLQNLMTPNMNLMNLQGINNGVNSNNAARQNFELMRAVIENYSRQFEQLQQAGLQGSSQQFGNYGGGIGGSFPGLDSYGGGAGNATQSSGGSGGGGLDFLQALNSGGGGFGGAGGLDYLQALNSGGGGGAAILQALMGGGGGGLSDLSNILGGDGGASMINSLAGLFGGLNF